VNVVDPIFSYDHKRLIIWHRDGRAYVLDLEWLEKMEGRATTLSAQELITIACNGPLASGLFDEAALEPYLDGREPQACR
jgi:hypothetical protein